MGSDVCRTTERDFRFDNESESEDEDWCGWDCQTCRGSCHFSECWDEGALNGGHKCRVGVAARTDARRIVMFVRCEMSLPERMHEGQQSVPSRVGVRGSWLRRWGSTAKALGSEGGETDSGRCCSIMSTYIISLHKLFVCYLKKKNKK